MQSPLLAAKPGLRTIAAALATALLAAPFFLAGPALVAQAGAIQFSLTNATQGPLARQQVFVTVTGLGPDGQFEHLDPDGQFQPCLPSDNTVPRGGSTWCPYSFPLGRVPSFTLAAGQAVAGGRLYLSFGSPLYLRVDPDSGGLVQPEPANPSDPNAAILFDWVEFTLDATGLYANTTCVDQFAVPITLEALDGSGASTGTVGLQERRSELVRDYLAEVPAPFRALAGELRITAPGHAGPGPLRAWLDDYIAEMWERYRTEPLVLAGPFIGGVQPGGALAFTRPGDPAQYLIQAMPTTLEAFRCDGVLAQGSPLEKALGAQVAALLNRHLLQSPLDWGDPALYYQGSPCNAYAAFWHRHGLGRKAYGFPYDDVNDQAALIHCANPGEVRLGFRID